MIIIREMIKLMYSWWAALAHLGRERYQIYPCKASWPTPPAA
jgi:hypothetical protein